VPRVKPEIKLVLQLIATQLLMLSRVIQQLRYISASFCMPLTFSRSVDLGSHGSRKRNYLFQQSDFMLYIDTLSATVLIYRNRDCPAEGLRAASLVDVFVVTMICHREKAQALQLLGLSQHSLSFLRQRLSMRRRCTGLLSASPTMTSYRRLAIVLQIKQHEFLVSRKSANVGFDDLRPFTVQLEKKIYNLISGWKQRILQSLERERAQTLCQPAFRG
jgi:hypothetical protein